MFRNKSKSRSIVSETKLDDSFPTKQFVMSGFYKPCRLDPCSNGGGFLLYVRNDLPSCLLSEYTPPENVEYKFAEINIRKKKCILYCSYNAHKNKISNMVVYLLHN